MQLWWEPHGITFDIRTLDASHHNVLPHLASAAAEQDEQALKREGEIPTYNLPPKVPPTSHLPPTYLSTSHLVRFPSHNHVSGNLTISHLAECLEVVVHVDRCVFVLRYFAKHLMLTLLQKPRHRIQTLPEAQRTQGIESIT